MTLRALLRRLPIRRVATQLRQRASRAWRGGRRGQAAVFMLAAVVVGAVNLLPSGAHRERGSDHYTARKGERLKCRLLRIADGDTITAECADGKVRVRLWGIDAPESGQKPWGARSRKALQQLLDDTLTLEIVDVDRYGRSVARIESGGRDVNLLLVSQGHAVVYRRYNRDPAYRKAEQDAKRKRLGIWSTPGAHQDPAAWRRLNNPRL